MAGHSPGLPYNFQWKTMYFGTFPFTGFWLSRIWTLSQIYRSILFEKTHLGETRVVENSLLARTPLKFKNFFKVLRRTINRFEYFEATTIVTAAARPRPTYFSTSFINRRDDQSSNVNVETAFVKRLAVALTKYYVTNTIPSIALVLVWYPPQRLLQGLHSDQADNLQVSWSHGTVHDWVDCGMWAPRWSAHRASETCSALSLTHRTSDERNKPR